jgi:ribose 1,5-bisphosphokinase PhnN
VLGVAKIEFTHKLQTLRDAAARHPTLGDLVASDLAAGAATVKNSATRNLHRLVAAIRFMQLLLERLMASPEVRATLARARGRELAQERCAGDACARAAAAP